MNLTEAAGKLRCTVARIIEHHAHHGWPDDKDSVAVRTDTSFANPRRDEAALAWIRRLTSKLCALRIELGNRETVDRADWEAELARVVEAAGWYQTIHPHITQETANRLAQLAAQANQWANQRHEQVTASLYSVVCTECGTRYEHPAPMLCANPKCISAFGAVSINRPIVKAHPATPRDSP